MKDRLRVLMATYGKLAIAIYFVIFLAVWGGFAIAIAAGFEIDTVSHSLGLAGASWAATKLTQPLRIAATALLTPVVARALERQRPTSSNGDSAPPQG